MRRELRPTIAGVVCIKEIDQSGQHCYDTGEHFLTGLNTIDGTQALSDRRIEAGGAFECRATGVIEILGALAPLTFSVPFGRIEKNGETRSVKLFNLTRVGVGPTIEHIAQKVGDPCDEGEFDAINVEFFVIKKGLHLENITHYTNVCK